MTSKRILLIAFLLVALVQLAIPVKMIWDREEILDTGTLYKFRTAPVDPNDPFRGKYIALTFRENTVEVNDGEEWIDGEPIYLTLTTDSNGFAKIDFVSKEMPSGQPNVIRAKVRYVMDEKPRKVVIDYPFDRFYMEESKALEAEILYRQLQADTNRVTYALVSIKNGEAVLSDVQIDGTSIIERVNKQKEK
ncbi:MAG: GDYXXLXY domain-containing protein [Verrucomicrobia bacterium]|nr:GDYXXLXY domain-containing protein [Prolixibacteraceae bacterium]